MRDVSWPRDGDARTFQRRLVVGAVLGTAVVAGSYAAAVASRGELRVSLLPLVAASLLLLAMWVHGSARRSARRREVERSFAGLRVLHHGESFVVSASSPIVGEHATRRHAARAAMERGAWAVVVHAWDRYYVLACQPASGDRRVGGSSSARPVAFRTRAVADVVPAIIDDKLAV